MIVHAAKLAQVGELVGSRDVANGRKNRVLDDRPQQHVRAEAGRSIGGFLHEHGRRIVLIAHHELAVLLSNGTASAFEMEQREAVVLRLHLRVIAARHEIGSGQRGELRGPARHRQLAGKDSADERLRRRIR